MTSTRHSYIQFYSSDWAAGTAGLPPLVEWAYFQICRFNWDKNEPVPAGRMALILGRDPNWVDSVRLLIDAGMIKHSLSSDQAQLRHSPNSDLSEGCFYNERALIESGRAFRLWESKSNAGKKGGRKSKPKTKQNQPDTKHSLSTAKSKPKHTETEPEPEPEPEHEEDDDIVDFSIRVCRSAGVRHIDPGTIIKNHSQIREWQELGLSQSEIVSVIAQCVGATDSPIHSLKYFDASMRRHVAKGQIPHGTEQPSKDRTANAGDRAVREIENLLGASRGGNGSGHDSGNTANIGAEPHQRRAIGHERG